MGNQYSDSIGYVVSGLVHETSLNKIELIYFKIGNVSAFYNLLSSCHQYALTVLNGLDLVWWGEGGDVDFSRRGSVRLHPTAEWVFPRAGCE